MKTKSYIFGRFAFVWISDVLLHMKSFIEHFVKKNWLILCIFH